MIKHKDFSYSFVLIKKYTPIPMSSIRHWVFISLFPIQKQKKEKFPILVEKFSYNNLTNVLNV